MRIPLLVLAASLVPGCDAMLPEVSFENSVTVPSQINNGQMTADSIAQPMILMANDGVKVFGTFYEASKPKALILLFHQAGSSKDEYATIAPRLNAAGYDALAIDQRSGGGLFGKNETAAALGRPADYLEAKRDMQAAIDWATTKKLPIALWGSSYSSSLVFVVAAENMGKVKAILAFSPGEYFDDKKLVAHAAAKVAVPVYVTVASGTEEAAAAKPIVDAVKSEKTLYIPEAGVHGSSTLIEAKDPAGAAANWHAVLSFIASAFG